MDVPTEAAMLARWAKPKFDLGRGVYQVTDGEQEHKHAYYYLCPWSPDGQTLSSCAMIAKIPLRKSA